MSISLKTVVRKRAQNTDIRSSVRPSMYNQSIFLTPSTLSLFLVYQKLSKLFINLGNIPPNTIPESYTVTDFVSKIKECRLTPFGLVLSLIITLCCMSDFPLYVLRKFSQTPLVSFVRPPTVGQTYSFFDYPLFFCPSFFRQGQYSLSYSFLHLHSLSYCVCRRSVISHSYVGSYATHTTPVPFSFLLR